MAMLYHEMGDDAAADQHFQKSLEVAGLHRSVDWSYRRCVALARLKESAGELDAAIDLLEEAKRFYIKTLIPHTRPVEALKARIYIKQGRLSKAEEWENKQRLSVDDELVYLREFEHITLARLLLAQYKNSCLDGTLRDAIGLLARLLKAAEEGGRIGSAIEIYVLQSLAFWAQGDLPAALIPLGRALTLAEPEGYVRTFLDEGSDMLKLLREAAACGIVPGYTGRLLAAKQGEQYIRETHLPASTASQTLIEALSQRELEILRLLQTELSVPEIARELVIAVSTVRSHTKSIYSKLGVNNRRAAVNRAAELNLM
jgi:LuxR family maltose regulon positive regulatory protein